MLGALAPKQAMALEVRIIRMQW